MKALVLLLLVSTPAAFAQTFTYVTENSRTTITGFAAEPAGAVIVPATLGGATVTAIGRAAFKDRAGITSISFTGSGVTHIGAGAFQGCTGLLSVTLPAGVTVLPAQALQGCGALQSVALPATLTAIGDAAFADCRSLSSLTLPAALSSIGRSAFAHCQSLTALSVPTGVTAIPERAFAGCTALATVVLPAGITHIGDSAFYRCRGLGSMVLPAATTAVGDDAFGECSSLSSLQLGAALADIGERAVRGCTSLATITVDAANPHFTSASGVLFDKAATTLLLCPEGKSGSYTVPSSIDEIAPAAFARCAALERVTLPSSLATLPDDVFYHARGLEAIDLPDNLQAIGAWALAGCGGLGGVVIPAAVTSVGDDAFHHATALSWALFEGDAPVAGEEVFDDAADDFTVFHFNTASGFTSPEWLGYPAVALGISSDLAAWLIDAGLAPGTDPEQQSGGVGLLTAYALGLDPHDPAAGLPGPVLTGGQLTLDFWGARDDVEYSVEASSDLLNWTTAGVTLADPDGDGMRHASIAAPAGAARFLRIVLRTD